MAAEIKLTKSDESPWGFRLTGGRDFGTPLTIIKVSAGSVAEEAGLQVGDILVKINDIDCHSLTHKEAQDVIVQSNNAVTFSVLRGSLSLSDDVIDRLTPLPLREFKTPEPGAQSQNEPCARNESALAATPTIEVIPIQDLEPELLEELGLNPLPEDFLEKAKRDPSPMPEVRPQSRPATPRNVLETLEDLGLSDVVHEIEKQKEEIFRSPSPMVPLEPQNQQDASSETQGEQEQAPSEQQTPASSEPLPESSVTTESQPQIVEQTPKPEPELIVLPITEQEFAEFISGQEEVIEVEGKNALGVDFKKFEPQGEFLRKSQVFRTIQDSEKVVSRDEKDKKWTTFLDKPRGPKPKPRPKPSKTKQDILDNPSDLTQEPSAQIAEERKGLYEIPSEEEFAALVKVPSPLPITEPEVTNEEPLEPIELQQLEEIESVKQQLQEEQENLQQQLDLEKELNPTIIAEDKSEVELQLEEIQRQLQAIQQLPFEIQQHLSLVQEQLNKIVEHRLHQELEQEEGPTCPRPSMVSPSLIMENLDEIKSKQELALVEEAVDENANENSAPVDESPVESEQVEEKKSEFKLRAEEEPAILPPPKKERPRKKRPFMGLGPAPRPLVLPGGRRWKSPKDAYNDEFIAETLSAQAEIITGSTLGVNFRKYEPKHPSLVHLRDSTVYKMIHDLEDPAVVNKGLAVRPEMVPAIQDYLPQTTSAAT